MPDKLFDFRMHDGSRNFADLPEVIFFDKLREIAKLLEGAAETAFVTDWVTEVWLDFDFRGYKFSINNQNGDYWFFVENPECPDKILLEVVEHFQSFIMKRMAFYGGSFDPPHIGHLAIARKLTEIFALDEFVFIPAFHAPHKLDRKPISAFHRYTMLGLTTQNDLELKVSTVELDAPEKPFTVETQAKLKNELSGAEIFFVIGADSWMEITTWRNWETVLTATNIIVVTRPDYEIGFSHVTEEIQKRTIDLRGTQLQSEIRNPESKIYFTDAVQIDVSATEIRRKIHDKQIDWHELVPPEVAKYIEKYELYI